MLDDYGDPNVGNRFLYGKSIFFILSLDLTVFIRNYPVLPAKLSKFDIVFSIDWSYNEDRTPYRRSGKICGFIEGKCVEIEGNYHGKSK